MLCILLLFFQTGQKGHSVSKMLPNLMIPHNQLAIEAFDQQASFSIRSGWTSSSQFHALINGTIKTNGKVWKLEN